MATEEIRADSYVGFDSITQQIEHKLLKRGFQFNVIVVGAYFVYCSFFSATTMTVPHRWTVVKMFLVTNVTLQDKLDWESLRSSTQFLRRT